MESILSSDFVLSQSNLQTYVDCQRRFWLTYVQQLPWPAVEAGPVQEQEYVMRLGDFFHRAVQRAEIGIDPAIIAAQLEDPLDLWFTSYLRHRPTDLPTSVVEVESVLTTPFQASEGAPVFRLAAKYDLLAIEPGERAVIVDWKTTRHRTDPMRLRRRLQSQVYPYLVVEASKRLPWGPLTPEQVEMRYWFTAEPDNPVTLRYDTQQHEANHQYLHRLVGQILSSQSEADFPKIPDTDANRNRVCAYCTYRSRCDRGIFAGFIEESADVEEMFLEPETELEISLDDVQELAF